MAALQRHRLEILPADRTFGAPTMKFQLLRRITTSSSAQMVSVDANTADICATID